MMIDASAPGLDIDAGMALMKSYVDEINELLVELGEHPDSMSRTKIQQTRQRLQRLKDRIRVDYRARSTIRGEDAMSDAEKSCVWPAIQEAATRIYISSRHRPSQQWIDELVDVRDSFLYYMPHLAAFLRQ